MSLGGVCLDVFKKLLVVGPGEIDPAVRWVYAVEATHRSSFLRPGPIARTASVRRKIWMSLARIMRELPRIQPATTYT